MPSPAVMPGCATAENFEDHARYSWRSGSGKGAREGVFGGFCRVDPCLKS